VHTPSFISLSAGIWNLSTFFFEGKDFDPRLCWIENACLLERAGHFTLKTSGAFFRVNVQRLLHNIPFFSLLL